MGSGNRTYRDELRGEGKGSFLSLASALRLASHPMFTGSVKGMNQPTRGRFEDVVAEAPDGGAALEISGRAISSVPLYAMLAYVDPYGRGDYDSVPVVAVPEAGTGAFRVSLEGIPLPKQKYVEVRLFALQVAGGNFRHVVGFRTDDEGRPRVEDLQAELQLRPLVEALAARDGERVRDEVEKLSADGKAMRIADRLGRGRPQSSLADISADLAGAPLGDFLPSRAEVGWGSPVYNRLPGRSPLLKAGGRLFETGIYAHAPALHRYELGDGDWKRLTGFCGIATGHRGKVRFRIVVDGKERWKSRPLELGQIGYYDVDLNGGKVLELIVEDLGDRSSDWGCWLDPMLRR